MSEGFVIMQIGYHPQTTYEGYENADDILSTETTRKGIHMPPLRRDGATNLAPSQSAGACTQGHLRAGKTPAQDQIPDAGPMRLMQPHHRLVARSDDLPRDRSRTDAASRHARGTQGRFSGGAHHLGRL